MADFDQKNIPTLDDIIDDEHHDATDADIVENEDSLDLFATEPDDTNANTEQETEFTEETTDIELANEGAVVQSIQISYEDSYSGLAFNANNDTISDEAETENDVDESAITTLIEPIELESIVQSVVKQMLPDLEQQLRFLLQQSLEEKLPAEMIKPADTNNDEA